MTAPIRTIIADDEPIARELIARLLASEPDIVVVDICSSGNSAIEAIVASKPDLVFLDIRMPDLDGLGVIRSLPAGNAPLFVLVTAFAEHAIDAFEVRAFDYVLKPIEKSRFQAALNNVRAAVLNRRTLATQAAHEGRRLDDGADDGDAMTHLKIRAGERVLRLPVEAVRFFEACSQYVQADFGTGAYLISTESLGSLEEKLPAGSFHRIHRGYLVGARHVETVVAEARGRMWATLSDGRRIPVSRRNRKAAEQLMIAIGDRNFDASN